ncbi:MAG: sigma-70 family RNA polymerase sigma factor [Nitrospira sp.]|nr:sigma-70 family RNA polymerase sigma factor [Nitrospira sp.]
MSEESSTSLRAAVEELYRTQSRQVLATLIRLLGDFDAAEEALHEAFTVAVEQWEREGIPANPRAWLVSTGRFKAIDGMRRRARFDASLEELARQLETATISLDAESLDEHSVEDDRLRLIFICCHPALTPEAQIAMTMREVCGLTTEEIARAFLTKPATIAQRIVRAKAKIRDAHIPMTCRRKRSCPGEWTRSCASSTSCSTKAIPPRPGTPSPAMICPEKPFVSLVSWCNSSQTRKRSDCLRSCCCRIRGATRASRNPAT